MINALRAQRLAGARAVRRVALCVRRGAQFSVVIVVARVGRGVGRRRPLRGAAVRADGTAVGANCVFLLPTPYELEAPPPPPLPPERSRFRDRLPVVYMRAGYARHRQRAFALGARPEYASWLNVSVVGRGVERVAFSEFARYRYLLDVGGVSGTTWSALRAKLLSGSLVFKVELDWQDWWHAHAALPRLCSGERRPLRPPRALPMGRGPPDRRAHRAERRASPPTRAARARCATPWRRR